jgi:hypothetical protein
MEKQYKIVSPAHFSYVSFLADDSSFAGIFGIAFRKRFYTAMRVVVMQYHQTGGILSLKLETN